ncbi:hypothetical protein [Sphingomonas aerophila]|nr:hypothetical protein [Sphingomonas aerophila]
MVYRALRLATASLSGAVFSLGAPALPAQAGQPTAARLVACGADSCLRLSGHRSSPSVSVQVNGRDLPVEGERAWQVTVPLSTARTWAIAHGYSVILTLVDAQAGTGHSVAVALPPGSLGTRLELASLIVRAH